MATYSFRLSSVAEVENQITGQNVGSEGKEEHWPYIASPETADEVAHTVGRGLIPYVAVKQRAGEEEQEEGDDCPQVGAFRVEFYFDAAGLRDGVRGELCSCFHHAYVFGDCSFVDAAKIGSPC